MRIEDSIKLDFSDVLIIPKTSTLISRSEVSVERTFRLRHAGYNWTGVPIIAANMDTVGTMEMADALSEFGICTALHKHYTVDELNSYLFLEHEHKNKNVFYSMGITEKDFSKLYDYTLKGAAPPMVCLDVANGHTMAFLDAVKKLRDYLPGSFIMAGNVVTPEQAEHVILAGADMVKVGIGPGSVCTTRKMTGVGYPQLSAIIECADAAHGLNGLVCGDGGCTVPGDIVKAFAGGADFVMLGGMFAGTKEGGGELMFLNHADQFEPYTERYKGIFEPSHVRFYGMSSRTANNTYNGGLGDYKAAEGKEVLVPYKGTVKSVVQEITGGIRSAMTYVGARKLKELTKRATFVRVNNQLNNVFTGKEV